MTITCDLIQEHVNRNLRSVIIIIIIKFIEQKTE